MRALPPADLIRAHTWIVEHFCAKYRKLGAKADLRAAGLHGLCEAAARFQPRRRRAFSTYAWNWVKGYMLSELRRAHVVPVPEHTARRAHAAGQPLRNVVLRLDPVDLESHGDPDNDIEQERVSDELMRRRAVLEAARELAPELRAVVRLVLGGESVPAIAKALKVKQDDVLLLLERAERELRELMAA